MCQGARSAKDHSGATEEQADYSREFYQEFLHRREHLGLLRAWRLVLARSGVEQAVSMEHLADLVSERARAATGQGEDPAEGIDEEEPAPA